MASKTSWGRIAFSHASAIGGPIRSSPSLGLGAGFAATAAYTTSSAAFASSGDPSALLPLPSLGVDQALEAVGRLTDPATVADLLRGQRTLYKKHLIEANPARKVFGPRSLLLILLRNVVIPVQQYLSAVVEVKERQAQLEEMGYYDEDPEYPPLRPFALKGLYNLARDCCIQLVRCITENFIVKFGDARLAFKYLKNWRESAVRKMAAVPSLAASAGWAGSRSALARGVFRTAARSVTVYQLSVCAVDQALSLGRFVRSQVRVRRGREPHFDASEGRPVDWAWLGVQALRNALRPVACILGAGAGAACASLIQVSLSPRRTLFIMAGSIVGEIAASIAVNVLVAMMVGRPSVTARGEDEGQEL